MLILPTLIMAFKATVGDGVLLEYNDAVREGSGLYVL
jgi:hypothetical protein